MELDLERDVYAVLRSRGLSTAPVRLLLEHPLNAQLITEGGCYHYQNHDKGSKLQVLKGLTSILRDFYWPSYSHRSKSRSAALRDIEKAAADERKHTVGGGGSSTVRIKQEFPTAQSMATGSVRGSIVHRQLAEWIKGKSRRDFYERNTVMHPLVTQALAALKKANLQPVAAEYQVAWIDGRLGTAIDIMCVNMKTGVVTAVEQKTSKTRAGFMLHEEEVPYEGKLKEVNRAHANALASSDCARARIQLCMSVLMAVEGLGFCHDFDRFVLLLAEDQPKGQLIEVNDKFLFKYGVPVYQDIQRRLPIWRAEQKALREQLTQKTKRLY
jgi:hypothetical protein